MSKEPKKVKKPRKSGQQNEIDIILSATYKVMDAFRKEIGLLGKCDAYPDEEPDMGIIDHDHTISQKRCKELGKIELIWDFDNIVYSSRKAHMEWESYKSGLFMNHANFKERMEFLKEHDPEGYQKRKQVVDSFTEGSDFDGP